jgi:hypothetical protein
MANGPGRGAVDAHFGQKDRKVFGLDGVALFFGEACGADRVLDHHAPYRAETNPDVFTAQRGGRNALPHVGSLLHAVIKFVGIVAVGG